MKKTHVKTHRRNGKVVRSHSRTMKGKDGGFDREMCISKYKKIVEEKGKNHPMAKKLLAKLEENGEDTNTIKKHARIDQVFMRKKIDKDLLVKESKTRKHARTVKNKKTGKWESSGIGSGKGIETANEEFFSGSVATGKVKNTKTGRMVSKEYLEKDKPTTFKTTKGGTNLGRVKGGMEYDMSKKPVGKRRK